MVLSFMMMVDHVHMSPVEVFNGFSSKLGSGMANKGAIDAGNFCNVLRYETNIVGHNDNGDFFVQFF